MIDPLEAVHHDRHEEGDHGDGVLEARERIDEAKKGLIARVAVHAEIDDLETHRLADDRRERFRPLEAVPGDDRFPDEEERRRVQVGDVVDGRRAVVIGVEVAMHRTTGRVDDEGLRGPEEPAVARVLLAQASLGDRDVGSVGELQDAKTDLARDERRRDREEQARGRGRRLARTDACSPASRPRTCEGKDGDAHQRGACAARDRERESPVAAVWRANQGRPGSICQAKTRRQNARAETRSSARRRVRALTPMDIERRGYFRAGARADGVARRREARRGVAGDVSADGIARATIFVHIASPMDTTWGESNHDSAPTTQANAHLSLLLRGKYLLDSVLGAGAMAVCLLALGGCEAVLGLGKEGDVTADAGSDQSSPTGDAGLPEDAGDPSEASTVAPDTQTSADQNDASLDRAAPPDHDATVEIDGSSPDGSPLDGSPGDASHAADAQDGAPVSCNPAGDPKTSSCAIADAYGIFVAGSLGSDSNAGTMTSPLATLAKAKSVAFAAKKRVFACATSFNEVLTLDATTDGVSLFGGLDCATWNYTGALPTVTGGGSPASTPLVITGLVTGATIEDFAFLGSATTSTARTSIAGLILSSANVALRRVTLTASAGADSPGGGAVPAAGANGQSGGTGVGSHTPGTTVCPDGTSEGGFGGIPTNPGTAGTPALGGGAGGAVGGGANAGDGANGSPGAGGTGAASAGSLTSTGWASAPGATGRNGSLAQGGGGGGGAQTGDGNPGGGGGSGGCGGTGGAGGGTGGSSVGLAAFSSIVTLDTCTVTVGNGGAGAAGVAAGSAGGTGGARGQEGGGSLAGNGGIGGGGGGGGGGAGGDSIAIAYHATQPVTLASTLSCSSPGVGAAGAAGGGIDWPRGRGRHQRRGWHSYDDAEFLKDDARRETSPSPAGDTLSDRRHNRLFVALVLPGLALFPGACEAVLGLGGESDLPAATPDGVGHRDRSEAPRRDGVRAASQTR